MRYSVCWILLILSLAGVSRNTVIATIRQGGLGFLTDPQRLNVAITRAVDAFVLVADLLALMSGRRLHHARETLHICRQLQAAPDGVSQWPISHHVYFPRMPNRGKEVQLQCKLPSASSRSPCADHCKNAGPILSQGYKVIGGSQETETTAGNFRGP